MRAAIIGLAVLLGGPQVRLDWTIAVPARGTPVVDPTGVFFLSAEHEVVRASDSGTVLWRRAIAQPGADASGATVVLGREVVVAGDYDVVAVDRRDGAIKWRFSPADGYGPGLYLGEISGDVIVAGSPAGRLYGIDVVTGLQRWSLNLGNTSATTVFRPFVASDTVVAGFTEFAVPPRGGIVAVDLATGRERWRRAFDARRGETSPGTGLAGGPMLIDQDVVAADAEGVLFGLNVVSGAMAWSIDDEQARLDRAANFRALAVASPTVAATSVNGVITGYSLRTHERLWTYDGRQHGSPAFQITSGADAIVVPYPGVGLVLLDPATGREMWRSGAELGGAVWPPLLAGNRMYVAGRRGVLAYARQ